MQLENLSLSSLEKLDLPFETVDNIATQSCHGLLCQFKPHLDRMLPTPQTKMGG